MIYECQHRGCDICGGKRQCDFGEEPLQRVEGFEVCRYCLRKALRLTLELAQTFGGTIIDQNKPCGKRATPASSR